MLNLTGYIRVSYSKVINNPFWFHMLCHGPEKIQKITSGLASSCCAPDVTTSERDLHSRIRGLYIGKYQPPLPLGQGNNHRCGKKILRREKKSIGKLIRGKNK
jgi:hypothetical protein